MILQFCRIQKVHGKHRAAAKLAVDFDSPIMRFDYRLCQRQAESDALRVLGEAAAVEALEDMVQILGVDAAAVVCDLELHGGGQGASNGFQQSLQL